MRDSVRPMTILVVEDHPDFAGMLLFMLRHLGLDACHVDTGEKAIDYLEEHKPDLILLDLNLPVIGGWHVLEFVWQKYGENGIPVVVATASGDKTNRLVGRLHDVPRYLEKPFTRNELYAVLDEMLELDKAAVP